MLPHALIFAFLGVINCRMEFKRLKTFVAAIWYWPNTKIQKWLSYKDFQTLTCRPLAEVLGNWPNDSQNKNVPFLWNVLHDFVAWRRRVRIFQPWFRILKPSSDYPPLSRDWIKQGECIYPEPICLAPPGPWVHVDLSSVCLWQVRSILSVSTVHVPTKPAHGFSFLEWVFQLSRKGIQAKYECKVSKLLLVSRASSGTLGEASLLPCHFFTFIKMHI